MSSKVRQDWYSFLSQYAGNFFERYALKWPVQEQSDCSYEYYILEVDGT